MWRRWQIHQGLGPQGGWAARQGSPAQTLEPDSQTPMTVRKWPPCPSQWRPLWVTLGARGEDCWAQWGVGWRRLRSQEGLHPGRFLLMPTLACQPLPSQPGSLGGQADCPLLQAGVKTSQVRRCKDRPGGPASVWDKPLLDAGSLQFCHSRAAWQPGAGNLGPGRAVTCPVSHREGVAGSWRRQTLCLGAWSREGVPATEPAPLTGWAGPGSQTTSLTHLPLVSKMGPRPTRPAHRPTAPPIGPGSLRGPSGGLVLAMCPHWNQSAKIWATVSHSGLGL